MYKEDQRLSAVPNLKINKANAVCMRSFNFQMVLNNCYQLKRIQFSKHMHYCIQNIYHMYLVLQRKRIRAIFSFLKLSQMHGFL